jgi:hypothetical protein
MATEDFVIACRTYNRSDLFMKKTYQTLERNNLTDKLFVFVNTPDDFESYSKVLQGKQLAKLVLGVKGINQITQFICDYFPVNQRIFFIDDDQDYYFFDSDKKLVRKGINLLTIILDGFETIDKYNLGLFGVNYTTNKLYIQNKPFKEFAPLFIGGGMYGTRNQKNLIVDLDSDGFEDFTRTVRFWDAYGGALLYYWCGSQTKPNSYEGGLKGTNERTEDHTLKQATDLLAKYPRLKLYCKDTPKWETAFDKWSVELKHLPQRKQIVKQLFPSVQFLRWSTWFQDEPDKIEPQKSL